MWPQECLTIATRAVTTGTKRKLKDGTFSITLTEAFTFDMALEEAYLKKVTSGFSNWYPQYWYTFVAIGYPSGDCSPLLISGCPTKAMAMGLGPSCALLEGGRDARKQQHREMMSVQDKVSSAKNAVSSSSGNKRQRYVRIYVYL
jgi:hypothetical protein